MTYDITIDGKNYRLELKRDADRWSCRVDGRAVEVDAVLARPDVLSLRIGNLAYEVKYERVAGETYLWVAANASRRKSATRALCEGAPTP